MSSYADRLSERIEAVGSRLCVGIDPRPDQHPTKDIEGLLQGLIEETADYAAAFKPNIAYFEALGVEGYQLLEDLLGWIPDEVPVILDCKRGDIGVTQEYYATAYFKNWDVDAVTLSPYLGAQTMGPFLEYPDKGVYLLGITTNEGSKDIQRKELIDGRSVYELVGKMAQKRSEQIGLVVGLTNVDDEILDRLPDVPLLIPGLGAQGGDLEALAGQTRSAPNIVNVSRGILYHEPKRSFADTAEDYANQITEVLG
jgi:orotidine-5'-phosphate decarboxylase